MSDKIYTPANGISYEVTRSTKGALRVKDETEIHEIALDIERGEIDSSTLRLHVSSAGFKRDVFWVYSVRNKRVLAWPGGSIELDAQDLAEGTAAGSGAVKPLKLTMPGKVLNVKVKEGDVVEAGQGLVIVEAMKMENLLQAPAKAKIGKVHVKPGDRLESGAVLITFESAE